MEAKSTENVRIVEPSASRARPYARGGKCLEQMSRRSSRGMRELLIPFDERLPDFGARLGQLFDLPIHFSEDALSRGPHVVARRLSGRARSEEVRDLLQREAEAKRVPHELNARDACLGIQPIACAASRRLRKKASPLVVAERVGAHTHARRRFTDAKRLRLHAGIIDPGTIPGSTHHRPLTLESFEARR
jgi:hypothetical protein